MLFRILGTAALALLIAGCGKENGASAPPAAVQDGMCTEAFIGEYNALNAQNKAAYASVTKKVEGREPGGIEGAKADVQGVKTRATNFKARFAGVTCLAKDLQTGVATTVDVNKKMDADIADADQVLRLLDGGKRK